MPKVSNIAPGHRQPLYVLKRVLVYSYASVIYSCRPAQQTPCTTVSSAFSMQPAPGKFAVLELTTHVKTLAVCKDGHKRTTVDPSLTWLSDKWKALSWWQPSPIVMVSHFVLNPAADPHLNIESMCGHFLCLIHVHAAKRRQLPDTISTDDPQLRRKACREGDPARGTTDSLDQSNFAHENEHLAKEGKYVMPQRLGEEAGEARERGGDYHPQHTARVSGGWRGGTLGTSPGRVGTRPGSAPSAR